jgi:threonine aldolase
MPAGLVDLRSDTVTRPTPEMRRAMAGAEVGDDVYGEDPTVNALEEAYAELVGKEAAIYVPSGTMCNQLAVMLQAPAGTTVIAGRRQHVVAFENGAVALNAGVMLHTVADDDGTIDPADVRWALEAAEHHWPTPSLVCAENTHMPAGGRCWPGGRLAEVAACGLPVHLDGARLFNAVVATGTTAAELAGPSATVSSCLSKGLAAPVGSVLAGPADVMAGARAHRRRLGGAMRQAGVIAAAGLVALRTMVDRLADDHTRARRLAEAVAERWPAAGLDPAAVQTNMVVFGHPDPAALLDHLGSEGVLAGTIAPGVVRLVTHADVDDAGVERACKALAAAPA